MTEKDNLPKIEVRHYEDMISIVINGFVICYYETETKEIKFASNGLYYISSTVKINKDKLKQAVKMFNLKKED